MKNKTKSIASFSVLICIIVSCSKKDLNNKKEKKNQQRTEAKNSETIFKLETNARQNLTPEEWIENAKLDSEPTEKEIKLINQAKEIDKGNWTDFVEKLKKSKSEKRTTVFEIK